MEPRPRASCKSRGWDHDALASHRRYVSKYIFAASSQRSSLCGDLLDASSSSVLNSLREGLATSCQGLEGCTRLSASRFECCFPKPGLQHQDTVPYIHTRCRIDRIGRFSESFCVPQRRQARLVNNETRYRPSYLYYGCRVFNPTIYIQCVREIPPWRC